MHSISWLPRRGCKIGLCSWEITLLRFFLYTAKYCNCILSLNILVESFNRLTDFKYQLYFYPMYWSRFQVSHGVCYPTPNTFPFDIRHNYTIYLCIFPFSKYNPYINLTSMFMYFIEFLEIRFIFRIWFVAVTLGWLPNLWLLLLDDGLTVKYFPAETALARNKFCYNDIK